METFSNANLSEIQQTLKLLLEPGRTAELRILGTSRDGVVSGYFNDFDRLAQHAAAWSGSAKGVYITINPVDPKLLARRTNRVEHRVKQTTSNSDIVKRLWLPIDFDPVRPSDIASTDGEHDAALLRAIDCKKFLLGHGFAKNSLFVADSGNGAHIGLRINLPNDPESTQLVNRCIEAVSFMFSDNKVTVDQNVSKAAQIWKLYGTLVCKGDSTADRPHRLAKLLYVPEAPEPVPVDLLHKLAQMAPEERKADQKSKKGKFDLEEWIEKYRLNVTGPFPWKDGRKWIFPVCPWNPGHTNRAAAILELGSGAISARCLHNGCTGKGWHDLRDLVEPDWRNADQDFTSDYREEASEAKWSEINADDLQRVQTESFESTLRFLPLLGQERFFVRGWSHLLAGYPRAGKSELLVRIIAEWSQEKILYISEEYQRTWKARLDKLPKMYSHVTLICGLGISYKDIVRRIHSGEETVVVIDAARNLLGLDDETDNSKVAKKLNPLISAAADSGKTLIIVHHSRKGGGEHGEGIAGGHAFMGVVDVALELKREGSEKSPRRILRGWSRVIETPDLIYERKDDNSMVPLGSPDQFGFAQTKKKVFSVLSDEWRKTKEIWEALGDNKPSEDLVQRALESLAQEQLAERDPPLADGKRQGVPYKWRRMQDFTSDGGFYKAEAKSGDSRTENYH